MSASGFSWQLMPHSHCLAVSWLLAELVGNLSLVISRLTDFVHVVMGLGFPRALEAQGSEQHMASLLVKASHKASRMDSRVRERGLFLWEELQSTVANLAVPLGADKPPV